MDTRARYDGGGCASVGFAGAFYAAGLDYQVSPDLLVGFAIGGSTSAVPTNFRNSNLSRITKFFPSSE